MREARLSGGTFLPSGAIAVAIISTTCCLRASSMATPGRQSRSAVEVPGGRVSGVWGERGGWAPVRPCGRQCLIALLRSWFGSRGATGRANPQSTERLVPRLI